MKPELDRMAASTLELVRKHGELPWRPGWAWKGKASPLTRSHQMILRDLAKQGLVSIDEDADLGVGRVTYTGPEPSGPGAAVERELNFAPQRAIFVVGSPDLQAHCRAWLRQHRPTAGIYVTWLYADNDRLWADGRYKRRRTETAIAALYKFKRPVEFSSTYDLSPAMSLAVRELNGEKLPDADEVYRGTPDDHPASAYRGMPQ